LDKTNKNNVFSVLKSINKIEKQREVEIKMKECYNILREMYPECKSLEIIAMIKKITAYGRASIQTAIYKQR
jgi:hypothetical protein